MATQMILMHILIEIHLGMSLYNVLPLTNNFVKGKSVKKVGKRQPERP